MAFLPAVASTNDLSSTAADLPSEIEDPWVDGEVTCEDMERHPDRVFAAAPDLGGGSFSPNRVEYDCPRNIGALPFMASLQSVIGSIRGDAYAARGGSVYIALDRYYEFSMLQAGYAPKTLLKAGDSHDDFEYAEKRQRQTIARLERWSYEGIYNFRLFKDYQREVARVAPKLANYYRTEYGFDASTSRRMAKRVLMRMLDWAAGSSPSSDAEETARLLAAARAVQGSRAKLERWLPEASPEQQLYALNVALLTGQGRARIHRLSDGVGELNSGNESPLFYALDRASNVEFLLKRGVDVNYQNPVGKTVLFYAIQFNDLKLAQLLLDHGADVNHKYAGVSDVNGSPMYAIRRTARSPLMHAAQHSDPAMLQLLLERGAHLADVDGNGTNAADYAAFGGRSANSAFFAERGLLPNEPKE